MASAGLAGLVVGFAAGFLGLEFPALGWAIGAAFVIGALLSKRRLAAIGGALLGFGASWFVLLWVADERCDGFNAPGRSCSSPDVSGWLTIAAVMAVAGGALLLAAAWRGRQRRPHL